MKTEQLKQIQNIEDKIQTRDDLKKQIEAWNKSIDEILRETHQKLASKSRNPSGIRPEELYWNLKRNHFYWDDLKKEWEQILRTNPEDFTVNKYNTGKVDAHF